MKTTTASDLTRKLLFYSLGAGAVTLAADAAHGTIVFTDLTGDPAATGNSIYYALQDTTGSLSATGADFELTTTTETIEKTNKAKAENSSISTGADTLLDSGNTSFESKLASGTIIGSGSFGNGSFMNAQSSGSPGTSTGDWMAGSTGYLGLEIVSGGTTLYGWAHVTLNSLPPAPNAPTASAVRPDAATTGYFTLLGYAYDNTGAAIPAGAVPEPKSTVALLIAGAAGAAALHRRRAGARV